MAMASAGVGPAVITSSVIGNGVLASSHNISPNSPLALPISPLIINGIATAPDTSLNPAAVE